MRSVVRAAEDEVVAGSAEDFGTAVRAGDDEVVAGAAERR